jgi:LacI family transcriptional regulator
MAATLADVARRVGVSSMTVSRVFRSTGSVSKDTREQVLAAGAALRYAPNLLARGLVQNRTTTIGVVVLELANPYFSAMVGGIQAACAKMGFMTVVGESGRDADAERRYVEQFRQFRVSGIIVNPVSRWLNHLSEARDGGTPVVVMERHWNKGDCVATDDVLGGQFVAQHFLDRGYDRIGLVRFADPDHSAIRARVGGFRHKLETAGVSIPPEWDLQVLGSSIESGMAVAEQLISGGHCPRALFVTSDRLAMGVIHQLLHHGIRVPQDVAIVGYDDIPFAACAQVPLTTVATPKRGLGEMSVKLLFNRIDEAAPTERQRIVLSPQLVVRESSP